MRLILIRHGQTPSNVSARLDTALPGADLSELGIEQAAALPAALAGETIDALYSSTAARAQQTIAPLATALGLPVTTRDGIKEISAGDVEMRNDRASIEVYVGAMMSWAAGDLDLRVPGGETGREALARFDEVIVEVASAGHETAVVVSHGAMLRVWTSYACRNIDARFVETHALSNTGIVVLTGSPADGWIVESWEGKAISGPELASTTADGPASETAERGF